jgi:DNA-binding beta-propeller fold protein YncE
VRNEARGTGYRPKRPGWWLATPFVLSLVLVMLGGCTPLERPAPAFLAEVGQDSVNSARLSCFVTLKESEGPALRLEVSALEVQIGDLWFPVGSKPVTLDAEAIAAGQVFLGGRALPPGHCQRLRLSMTQGTLRRADDRYAAIAQEPFQVEIAFPTPLRLDPGDSRAVLINWDVQASLEASNHLRPVLTIAPQLRQLLVDLIYVACPEIDTVFLVRADRNWVVDAFGLRGRPTYLAVNPLATQQRLYVLAAREATIKVVDLGSHRVVDFFPVPLNDRPTFMTISPDGLWGYLLDERSGYLSRMDLSSGRSAARVRLGSRPQYAVFLERQNLLAVSLGHSQQVVLLDPLTLAMVRTVASGSVPQGLLATADQLYVAESGDHMVSILDLARGGSLGRLAVGFGPRRRLAAGSFFYVSNYDNGSLSVLAPGQLGVIREIHGLGRPQEMVFDRLQRRLYVADEEAAALVVIDVNSNQLVGRIALGARPSGLAIIQ